MTALIVRFVASLLMAEGVFFVKSLHRGRGERRLSTIAVVFLLRDSAALLFAYNSVYVDMTLRVVTQILVFGSFVVDSFYRTPRSSILRWVMIGTSAATLLLAIMEIYTHDELSELSLFVYILPLVLLVGTLVVVQLRGGIIITRGDREVDIRTMMRVVVGGLAALYILIPLQYHVVYVQRLVPEGVPPLLFTVALWLFRLLPAFELLPLIAFGQVYLRYYHFSVRTRLHYWQVAGESTIDYLSQLNRLVDAHRTYDQEHVEAVALQEGLLMGMRGVHAQNGVVIKFQGTQGRVIGVDGVFHPPWRVPSSLDISNYEELSLYLTETTFELDELLSPEEQRDKRPIVIPPIGNETQSSYRKMMERTWLLVPMVIEGRIEALFIGTRERGYRPFQHDEMAIAETLTEFISLIVRSYRTQRLHHEVSLAALVQRQLTSLTSTSFTYLDIAGRTQSKEELNGDYYDILSLPDGRVALVVGDAMGKGIPAAVMVMMAGAIIRSAVRFSSDPGTILSSVNKTLSALLPSGMFVTLTLLIASPKEETVQYANAAHVPPLLVYEGARELLHESGLPLGVEQREGYRTYTHRFPRGSVLFLYSDGLVDWYRNGDTVHRERDLHARLVALAAASPQTASERVSELFSSMASLLPTQAWNDDATLLMCRFLADSSACTI